MAQIALSAVGYVVGGFFGFPQLGAIIGGMVGSAIAAPDQSVEGPRLSDLKVMDSAYGNTIPRIYGKYRVALQPFYSEDLREVKTTEDMSGKGGPSVTQTTYQYFFTGALGICDCTDGIPALGISQLFANGDLLWDGSASVPVGGTAGDSNTYPPGSTLTEDEVRAAFKAIVGDINDSQGDNISRYVKFYDGSLDQMPDARMQSVLGDMCPAYRGLCYLMAEDMPLADYGNRPPQMEATILRPLTSYEPSGTTRANGLAVWKKLDGASVTQGNFNNQYIYRNKNGQTQWLMKPDAPGDMWLARLLENDAVGASADSRQKTRAIELLKCIPGQLEPVIVGQTHLNNLTPAQGLSGLDAGVVQTFHVSSSTRALVGLYRSNGTKWQIDYLAPEWDNTTRSLRIATTFGGTAPGGQSDPGYVGTTRSAHATVTFSLVDVLDIYLTCIHQPASNWYWRLDGAYGQPGGLRYRKVDLPPECRHADCVRDIAIIPGHTMATADIYVLVGVTSGATKARVYKLDIDGNYTGTYAELTVPPTVSAGAQSMHVSKDGKTVYVLAGDATSVYDQYALWEWRPGEGATEFTKLGQLERTVINGGAMSGADGANGQFSIWTDGNLVLGSINDNANADTSLQFTGIGAWRLGAGSRLIGNNRVPTNVTIADIIRHECRRAGFEDDMVEIIGLDADVIEGYASGRVASPRAMIEPLRGYKAFDMIESDKLKFVERGLALTRMIDVKDLGVSFDGEDPGALLKIKRVQELDMPRRVNVSYAEVDGDFQQGSQYARRDSDLATNEVNAELPIAMTAGRATYIANVMLYGAVAARHTAEFSLGLEHAELEPGDTVSFTHRPHERWRLIKRDEDQGVSQYSAVSDLQRVYEQGQMLNLYQSAYGAQTADAPLMPIAWLFDLPPVLKYDDRYPHILAAIRPIGLDISAWKGAAVINRRSTTAEGDIAIAEIQTAASEPTTTLGFAISPPGATDYRGIDLINDIEVQVIGNSELVSVTEEQMLAGANEVLVGNEILCFQTATVIGSTETGLRYRLSLLLRGRRDTPTTHEGLGEQFVLLSTARIVYLSRDDVGEEVPFAVIPRGTSRSAAITDELVSYEAAVVPRRATNARAGKDVATGNIMIAWAGQRMSTLDSLATVEETGAGYEIEVIDSAGNTLSTISGTGHSCLFTAANNVALFGAATYTGWTARLYRVSPRWGRSEAVDIVIDV